MTQAWHAQALALNATGTMSKREIAEAINVPKSTVSDFLRGTPSGSEGTIWDWPTAPDFSKVGNQSWLEQYKKPKDNSRILFISDQHIPYHHPNLLDFLYLLKQRYEPTRIINLGDELDKHALSYHDSDPDLDSAGTELQKSLPVIAEMHKMFPEMDLIESNHGSLVWRKAKTHGISRAYIKSYNDVLQVGEGWVWHPDLTIKLPDGQDVYVHHGKSPQALRTAQLMGMSHVSGHYHEQFGIQYWSTPTKLLWGMNTGCLIDRKSLAFQYNNVNIKRPVIGTGLIIDGRPILEAMPL